MTDHDAGERLAARLEHLGLVGALGAAGLPTLSRAPDGRAVWSDPLTGRALSEDEIERVDELLRREGSDPRHAVPVGLVQVARQARLRAELLVSPWFDYGSLAVVRGATVEATRFAVHKAEATHRLLVVPVEERVVVPGFQLDEAGEVRADLVPVLEPLLAARTDPWLVWAWLTHPAALLGGLVPERAAADPEEADVVLHAAVRLAERTQHAGG